MTEREKVPQKPPYNDEIEVEIDFRMNVCPKCDPWSLDRVSGISGNDSVVLKCDRVIRYKAFCVPWPSDRERVELEGLSLIRKREINSAPQGLTAKKQLVCTEQTSALL